MKTISEIKEVQKTDFIIKDLLKENGLYCLVARPKIGKSFFVLQLANAIANGSPFLNFETKRTPVLYISTEVNASSLYNRIQLMNCNFDDSNFFFISQEENPNLLNLINLESEFQDFKTKYNGKLVIIDMLYGIDVGINYDINNYQDMGQKVFPKLRELCNKYLLTILFVHHLNKSGTSLGSTAIDTSVDGKFTLKQNEEVKTTFYLNYQSRDFEGKDITLSRDEHMNLSIDEESIETLNPHLMMFLNYAITKKEFSFTMSEVTSKLNMLITASAFGKLVKDNLTNLEQLGLHITANRSAKKREYYARYEEPMIEIESLLS